MKNVQFVCVDGWGPLPYYDRQTANKEDKAQLIFTNIWPHRAARIYTVGKFEKNCKQVEDLRPEEQHVGSFETFTFNVI